MVRFRRNRLGILNCTTTENLKILGMKSFFRNFRKNFTWRGWLLGFIFIFLFTLAAVIIFDLVSKNEIAHEFTLTALARRVLMAAAIAAFIPSRSHPETGKPADN
jgi:hypothetical protein